MGALRRIIQDRSALAMQLLYTMISTLFGLASYWCSAQAAGAAIDLLPLMIAVAIAVLASVLPISLSGWGVREGALVSLLEQLAGLDPARASLIAAANALTIVAVSLVGLTCEIGLRRDSHV